MSTHRPEFSADEIIEGCAQAGVSVTKPQLGRWSGKDLGLLPPPTRRGRKGEGRGVTWVWDAECLPRAIIIARTLQHGDPSLKQAAMELWIRGYVSNSSDLLSELLHHVVAGLEKRVRRRQTYLKRTELSVYERRRRFARAEKRKLAAAPQELRRFGILAGQGLVGLTNSSTDDFSALTSSVSFERLHEIIDATTDTDIMRAATRAVRLLQAVDGLLTPLLQAAFDRGRSHRRNLRQAGVETPVQSDHEQDHQDNELNCLWFAPFTTLGLIALRKVSIRHLKASMSLLKEMVREILGPDVEKLESGMRDSVFSGKVDDIVTFVEPTDEH